MFWQFWLILFYDILLNDIMFYNFCNILFWYKL